MRKSVAELNRIPNEFHEGGAPELPELPDEFNRFTPPTKDDRVNRRKKLMKMLMILAAAGVILVSTVSLRTAPEQIPPESEPSNAEAEQPAAPTPEPEPLPDCEPIYFYTHSVSNAIVLLSDPAHTVKAYACIWDEQVSDAIIDHDFTAEEIAAGVWEELAIDTNDFYWKHAEQYEALETFVQPTLYVTITYRLDDGTEGTITRTAAPTAEDYVYVDYHDSDLFENEWTFPGCFAASVYDTQTDPLLFTTDPDHELQPGEIFLSVTVNGERIPEENCSVKRLVDSFEYEGETFTHYSFFYIMRRPDSFPEHGTAHVIVKQKLIHYDYIREWETDIEY